MFIFLLFASDGCRNVCQLFSQRLGAHLRKHRRRRSVDRAEPEKRKDKRHDSQTQQTHTPAHGTAASQWRASLRTWIKCLCAGTCAFAPATSDGGGRVCVDDRSTTGTRIRTMAKLLLQKLLHQA